MTLENLPDRLARAATALAAVASLAGLLIPELYRDAPFWAQQARGIDVATLLLATPILAAGLWASRRGSPLGRLAVLGGLLYLIYNYAIYATSVAMNPLAAVYILILGLAVWSFGLSLTSVELAVTAEPVLTRLPRRTAAWFLVAVAVLFGLLWLGQIVSFTFTGVVPADLVRADLPANPVYAMDLALFLPLAAVAGIGILRGRASAAAYAEPMLIWVFLTSAGIVGGFLFASMAGDEVPIAVAMVVGGVGVLAAVLGGLPLVGSSRDRS